MHRHSTALFACVTLAAALAAAKAPDRAPGEAPPEVPADTPDVPGQPAKLRQVKPRAQPSDALGPDVPAFTVRPGYRVTLAATFEHPPRFMEFDDRGTLYVSHPDPGLILALTDTDGDGSYEKSTPYITDRPKAQAMQFKDGWLWFAQSGSVHRARDANGDGKAEGNDEIVTLVPEGSVPGGTGHWWRSLLVTGNALYTSIGDTSNITDESQTDRQKIWRYDHEGKNKTLFATGIRNTEELQLRPGTDEIWGVDHGSDHFGQPLGETEKLLPVTSANPPDEFNRYVEGQFYGHPFITGNRLPRIEYHGREDILQLAEKTTPPEWTFGAHWAANGWTFLKNPNTRLGRAGDAFVACRGSWNSASKVGYRVQRVLFDPWTGRPCGSVLIVSTLAEDGDTVLARPVDCAEAPDGSVLFSCDTTRRVYRISRSR